MLMAIAIQIRPKTYLTSRKQPCLIHIKAPQVLGAYFS